MSDFVRKADADAIIERAGLESLRFMLETLADYLECRTDAERELVLVSARAQLDAMQAASAAAIDGLDGYPAATPEPLEVVDGKITIQFTPQEAKSFKAWQAEQRAKLAVREAADRQPWEANPDAWRDQ